MRPSYPGKKDSRSAGGVIQSSGEFSRENGEGGVYRRQKRRGSFSLEKEAIRKRKKQVRHERRGRERESFYVLRGIKGSFTARRETRRHILKRGGGGYLHLTRGGKEKKEESSLLPQKGGGGVVSLA